MSNHHHFEGNTVHGPVYLLPRYPAKVPGGGDITPSHRRYPVGHQRHRSQSTVARSSWEEDRRVEHGSLSPWLPRETMNAKDKVIAWLIDEKPFTRTPNPSSPTATLSPTQNNIPTPPGPSGRPLAVRKARSIASFLHKTPSKPNLRNPLRFRQTSLQSNASNNSLDSELTCRGLPNMMIKKEMKMTRSAACPVGSTDKLPQAVHEEVINSFQDSMVITPDENVKVTKFKADANDESLQRYKKSLGLGGGKDLSDPNDPRVCIIQSLTMESPGRDPVTIDLSQAGSESTLKDKPFKIKEGAKFTMVASFRVQHEILSGLQYVQTVKRKGIRVSKDSEMLGSYAPNTDKQPIYTKRFQEEDAPSGMLARGHYNAVSTFVDDDKKQHLQFEWSFDISKDCHEGNELDYSLHNEPDEDDNDDGTGKRGEAERIQGEERENKIRC
ncbi:hypothetical protein CIB48_g4586 [Xylaria polymorpha]|nr:hypothetical protein CIB48_g4586 [Xylaria polymorpha]